MEEFNQIKYMNDWKKEKKDRLILEFDKGSKDIIIEYCRNNNYKSYTEYIRHLIESDMQIKL